MSATLTATGTVVDPEGDLPLNEGQSVHERNLGGADIDSRVGIQSDRNGFQELNDFIRLMSSEWATPPRATMVRLRSMLADMLQRPEHGETRSFTP